LGSTLIVEGIEGQTALNEGSILWLTDKRLALGIIDELFGPVKKPFYLVRYNTSEEIPEEAKEGVNVSYVQEFADFALNKPELYAKGYDAFDEELSDSEIEFSDDEKEAEYWRSKGHVKRERETIDSEDWFSSGRKGEDDPCRRGNKNSRTRGNRKDSQVNNVIFLTQ
jgi:H/ACA ribonucleoprotein complex non-core subunit NAF1